MRLCMFFCTTYRHVTALFQKRNQFKPLMGLFFVQSPKFSDPAISTRFCGRCQQEDISLPKIRYKTPFRDLFFIEELSHLPRDGHEMTFPHHFFNRRPSPLRVSVVKSVLSLVVKERPYSSLRTSTW